MRFRKLHPPAGARPGTLLMPKDAHFPRVRLIRYNESAIEDREVDDIDTVSLGGGFKSWIDVQGLGRGRRRGGAALLSGPIDDRLLRMPTPGRPSTRFD